jgi:hypothetical protein
VNAVAGGVDEKPMPPLELAPAVDRRKASRPWTGNAGKRNAPVARPDPERAAELRDQPLWKEI